MKYLWKYWYGVLFYKTPNTLDAKGTIIKSRNLQGARESLDSKIKSYIKSNPNTSETGRKLSRLTRDYINKGFLRELRKDIKPYSF